MCQGTELSCLAQMFFFFKLFVLNENIFVWLIGRDPERHFQNVALTNVFGVGEFVVRKIDTKKCPKYGSLDLKPVKHLFCKHPT